jgi:XTP/dITP diphosphohydrolase
MGGNFLNMDYTVVLATGNPGKLRELGSYFSHLPIHFRSQKELSVSEVEETGTTFIENAVIKARHAAKETGLPALADDSGLVVPALNGEPGIYSARYAGVEATDQQRMEKLLAELEKKGQPDRGAFFCCALAFFRYAEDPVPITAIGQWHGSILHKPAGTDGFGYDPIFSVPTHNCSAAQLNLDEKNRISHRGLAMQQLVPQLENILELSAAEASSEHSR